MTDFEKFEELYYQIDMLISNQVHYNSPQFKAWHNKCICFLSNHYGVNSPELKTFESINFYIIGMDSRNQHEPCRRGLETAKLTFAPYFNNLVGQEPRLNDCEKQGKSIFIVHGHDEAFKERVARLFDKLQLSYIILNEHPNLGNTVIEKLENCATQAKAAIVLFTPDDIGKAKTEKSTKNRARQNVVFEAGYFMGFLGRKNTMLIVSDNSIEMPSDLNGIVYDGEASQLTIAKELKAMGFDIDYNRVFK